MSLAMACSSAPISVGAKGAPASRWNKGAPTISSRIFSWMLIAGGVTFSVWAAPVTEPRSTVAASARNCFRVSPRRSII